MRKFFVITIAAFWPMIFFGQKPILDTFRVEVNYSYSIDQLLDSLEKKSGYEIKDRKTLISDFPAQSRNEKRTITLVRFHFERPSPGSLIFNRIKSAKCRPAGLRELIFLAMADPDIAVACPLIVISSGALSSQLDFFNDTVVDQKAYRALKVKIEEAGITGDTARADSLMAEAIRLVKTKDSRLCQPVPSEGLWAGNACFLAVAGEITEKSLEINQQPFNLTLSKKLNGLVKEAAANLPKEKLAALDFEGEIEILVLAAEARKKKMTLAPVEALFYVDDSESGKPLLAEAPKKFAANYFAVRSAGGISLIPKGGTLSGDYLPVYVKK